MTRYARAKGSKASNERTPNDATPWHVMKQQLVENLSKKQEPSEKIKSAKELLEDKQNTVSTINSENNDNSWAEFQNNSDKRNHCTPNKVNKKQKAELNKVQTNQNESFTKPKNDNDIKKKRSLKSNINEVDNFVVEIKNKKHKKGEYQPDDISNSKKEYQRQKDKYNISEIKDKNDALINLNESQKEKDTLSKRQKRNMKRKNGLNSSVSNTLENNNDNKNNNDSIAQNNADNNENENKGNDQTSRRFNKNFITQSKNFKNIPNKFGVQKSGIQKKKRKPPKIRDDKEHKRRKPDLGSLKIMINGVEVEIVKFDGFPVKKEDADRLNDLKQKMIMKGIPKKEIDAAMKLERRKAEKALARIKKFVCFHCRKAGHNLSDCPELGSEQAGTGICFKCGSTEHTHFECKVAKPTEFRYATCFICREQGHIAKQCPDNPKGVYPQGGACKICGDVTHLKKDCPDLIKEKEENTITVNTIADGNLESLGENTNSIDEKNDKRTKKIVKF